MSCCRPLDEVSERSKSLDKQIATWMKEYKKTIKFLLLGAGESGKTTILKQMKILHIQGFSDEERKEKVADIRRNLLEAIKELTGNMTYLRPPEKLTNPSNELSFNFITELSMTDAYDFPQQERRSYMTCLSWRQ